MDQSALETELAHLPLSGVKYFDRVGSTNDEAARWVNQGAGNLSLVVADEQTAGRGRMGRTWYTPPGASLAFSLVLLPAGENEIILPRLTALGALAVCDALQDDYKIVAQIKWPNDVLIERRKAAGVLAEAHWDGERLQALVLGVGVNVSAASVSEKFLNPADLPFPATSIEAALGHPVDRLTLLRRILEKITAWRDRLASPSFLQAWEAKLAFRGEWVMVMPGGSPGKDGLPSSLEHQLPPVYEGQIVGLAPDGMLKLRTAAGGIVSVRVGEVRLRPTSQPAPSQPAHG